MKSGNSILGASTLAIASSVRIAIQIVILPIIGRMLGPHVYGQIALVAPFIFFAMLISSSGLSTCVVRAIEVTPELEGTIFCFSAGVAVTIMLVFAILAYPLGHFFHDPEFPPLLFGMSSILLVSSFQIVPAGILLREKKYDWLALSDIASSLAGISGVVVGIFFDWGAWSLVAQQIALWLCKIIVTTWGSRVRPRFIFRWNVMRENLRFGAKLTGSAIVGFIASNIDNVLIGAFLGTEALGFYALAYQIIGLPQIILSGSVYFTLMSGVSEAQREGKPVSPLFLKTMRGSILIGAPVIAGMAVASPLFVPLIMSPKWTPMAKLLTFLAPFGLAQLFGIAISGFLIGLGNSSLSFKLTLITASLTVISIIAGICFGSSGAVAIAVSTASLLGLGISLYAVMKKYNVQLQDLGYCLAAPLISGVIMVTSVLIVQQVVPDKWPLVIQLAVSVISGIITYILALFVLFRDQMTTDIADIRIAFRIPSRKRQ